MLSIIGERALRILRGGRKVDATNAAANGPATPPVVRSADVPGLHRLFPHTPRYLVLLALEVARRGDRAGALTLLEDLESRHGPSEESAVARARLLGERNDRNAAIAALEHVSAGSRNALVHVLLGENYFKSGRLEQADRSYAAALELNPHSFSALASRAATAGRLGRLDEAIGYARRALRYDPRSIEAWANLHWLYGLAKRFDDEARTIDEAIEVFPVRAEYTVIRGLLRLLRGEFSRGWEDFEARLRDPERYSLRPSLLQRPMWRGEPFAGKTLLVYGEQGAGDSIMMARYLPRVKALGGRVIYEAPEGLHELLDSAGGVDEWLPRDPDREPDTNFDLWTPSMSLARTFAADLSNIPSDVPYLSVDPEVRAFWTELVGSPSRALRVGLAWAGNPNHLNDFFRSIPLDIVAPLVRTPGAVFYRLHLEGPQDLSRELPGVRDLTEHVVTFTDTAALIEQMDLVITVDTSIAHLAGALARPTWVMLPYLPDWRWLLDRVDSPWYPTARLFRQPQTQDWRSVLAEVTTALREQIAQRVASTPLLEEAR